ncbi:NADPH-dependent 2,4-dienoyl-CoA reductase, sulfur reductase [Klenkia marina]|uniref:NADPH-dependent 2,4-dienoyl-CoA reductase, sulfur reductase n=1 Tax=Klenkia marina TaxID=1960309 RepID=A0A1G4XWE9_9ACTN|nr:FAD-dependent oxidoreductase [Klenkia marina]SCX45495.1 NADPH-dependent 2,4-dienoyl-CoA reductase, sulfur reductase [Klenkia marina]
MSRHRLLVIGGDAGGMSAAAQAHRIDDSIEVVVLEQGHDTSFSACGIPYWVGDLVGSRDDLVARTPEEHRRRGLTVHTGTRAEAVDLDACRVSAADGRTFDYDTLLLATGGRPTRPPIEGLDAPGVFGVHRLDDGAAIRSAIDELPRDRPRKAVVLGGGYIGLEMAEVLQLRGLDVDVVLADPLPMGLLDADMGERVCDAMRSMGMGVHTDARVTAVLTGADGRACGVRTDDATFDADLVVLGLGMGPEARLAEAAGLGIGVTGGIDVDATMRSRTHENVFAAGDCVQTYHHLTGEPAHVALGTHANKQGRVAGSVIAGRPARFAGVLGTAITKVGDTEIGRTGLCTTQAEQAGFDFRTDVVEATTRAGYYPGAEDIAVKLVTEAGSGRLLGGQVVGGQGAGKRVDVLATAIWGRMTAEELSESDLSYAPPFSPTYDPVAVAARVVSRAERG